MQQPTLDGPRKRPAAQPPPTKRRAAPAAAGSAAAGSSAAAALTPLERQITALRAQHSDMVLAFEVGYKLKFYEDDALIASELLGIAAVPEKHLLGAMIPVPRLSVHIRRLVDAGHKVGIVRQTESRALKASSETASAPFARELREVYTAATWIDALGVDGAPEQVLTAVVADRDAVGVAAIDVATAAITYDAAPAADLETRLAHLAPREVLGHTDLPAVRAYARGTACRLEDVDCPDAPGAGAALAAFFDASSDASNDASDASDASDANANAAGGALTLIHTLPPLTQRALAALISHLAAFGLTSAFHKPANYRSFADRTSMTLSANTLRDLELLTNTTDGREHGSLFWVLDHCHTPMGRRLLRRWTRRPLIDITHLHARQGAVAIIRTGSSPALQRALALRTRIPDLERGLARIVYGRAAPSELATVLLTLFRVTHEVEPAAEPHLFGTGSALLDNALAALSGPRAAACALVDAIRITEARRNNKTDLYTDPERYATIAAAKQVLVDDDLVFATHLAELRTQLGRPHLQYTSVSGVDHLIEFRVKDALKAPADWIRISSTKAVVRFHTPTVQALTKQRDRHREELEAAARDAFQHFCGVVAAEYDALRGVVDALALLDALASLADVAAQPGYTRPVVDNGPSRIALTGFRHPMSEALSTEAYVPNDITLGADSTPAVLLTGANMGGKSSTVRAVALAVVLAHIGSSVPCDRAEMSCHDCIATRMGAHDDILRGKSTFFVEAEETAHILRTASERSLVILDEFGRGTSTFDGTALAYAALQSLLERGPHTPHLLFITHYTALGALAAHFPHGIRNMHMATHEEGLEIVFLHRLEVGLAAHSLGIHVAASVGMPPEIIERALGVAESLRCAHDATAHRRRIARYARLLRALYAAQDQPTSALEHVRTEALTLKNV